MGFWETIFWPVEFVAGWFPWRWAGLLVAFILHWLIAWTIIAMFTRQGMGKLAVYEMRARMAGISDPETAARNHFRTTPLGCFMTAIQIYPAAATIYVAVALLRMLL